MKKSLHMIYSPIDMEWAQHIEFQMRKKKIKFTKEIIKNTEEFEEEMSSLYKKLKKNKSTLILCPSHSNQHSFSFSNEGVSDSEGIRIVDFIEWAVVVNLERIHIHSCNSGRNLKKYLTEIWRKRKKKRINLKISGTLKELTRHEKNKLITADQYLFSLNEKEKKLSKLQGNFNLVKLKKRKNKYHVEELYPCGRGTYELK